jgi:hypothetical protein
MLLALLDSTKNHEQNQSSHMLGARVLLLVVYFQVGGVVTVAGGARSDLDIDAARR